MPFIKMSIQEFQKRVLDELGQIKTDVAVLKLQVSSLEKKQCNFEDKAETTGRFEIERLQTELNSRRKEWFSWIGKAALLIIGSILATIVPRFL